MNRENGKPFAHSKDYLYFWQKYSDQMNENVLAKLKILAESAKYDVSCSSSGTVRRNQSGALGNTVGGWGICHSFAEDGRCISLLKIMLTNYCIYDCAYCINRRSNDIPRATLSVSELVDLTIEFYRRNYIEGLFLSSGVVRNPDYTMERLVRVAKDLRLVHKFNGYIHLKSIPGASRELVNEAGLYADRLSVNREIPKEERRRERNKKLIRYGVAGVAGVVVLSVLISLMRTGVKEKDLVFSTVDQGTIEVSVSASGKVVPAFEEIINSPINTRILEVYKKGGDSVDVGTPILKLDLQSAETEYKKQLDEEQMKRYQLEQLEVNNSTYLSDLEMQVKVSEMKLNRMEVELRNERYLDSLGSGTTDRVHQAELNFKTGKLELEQLRQQLANERKVKAADLKVKQLEYEIFRKSLAETKRTLDDAQVRSPRKAILTYINNQIGAQVGEGTQIAVISDLSHFKVEGEIADTYGDRVAAGGRAIVKIGSEKLEGQVSSVTPLSKNGVISFTVQLEDDSNRRLRSGLKTDVYVMNAVKEDVMRVANASYYVGRGEYDLFVRDGEGQLVKRKVQLGDSNFEYVEVVSGLKPGDQVVVSDMSQYKNKNKLKLKD